MNGTIFRDGLMNIEGNYSNYSYHEIESEMDGELETITIDKNTGKIFIRFKADNREKQFNEIDDYVKPLDKDKDFKINIIEN